MRRPVPALAGALLLLPGACGSGVAVPPPAGPDEPPLQTAPTSRPDVRFRPCDDTPPAPGTTHLRASAEVALPPYAPGSPALSGPVRLQHVLTLHLPTGRLLAGSGADAVWASGGYGFEPFALAEGPVDVEVTAAVWEPGDDRRVAWLELIPAGAAEPVAWETVPALGILTDGGDGGFWSTTAAPVDPGADGDPGELGLGETFDAYLETATPSDGRPYPLCVVRSSDGVEDGIVFPTGIGDGWYPTHAGRDAAGRVVALLSDGGMPWSSSGLPGTPPPSPPDAQGT
ncbi:DUF4241 domain-containing protein [Kineococcus sp. SYSU DK006]|uniref:DUF4241 domain-containing protein n=1 Tax=Kineococcus sp. SYSU DK006 TaxID=3383127 RepID=UPI003D7D63FF